MNGYSVVRDVLFPSGIGNTERLCPSEKILIVTSGNGALLCTFHTNLGFYLDWLYIELEGGG